MPHRFTLLDDLPIKTIGDGEIETATLCLDGSFSGDVKIGQPFPDNLDDASPLQEPTISYLETLTPFQEVFEISLEELTQLALQSNNACIETSNF